MRIKVYNDGEEVFHGLSEQFLMDNDWDEEVQDMIDEAKKNGSATRNFYHSGEWEVKVQTSTPCKESDTKGI